MSILTKFSSYARAASANRSFNLRGLPGIPKVWWPDAPSNREAFNHFQLWIHRLQLRDVAQVVDVGANHGDFSQAASAILSRADVLLVEPLPTLHEELEARCGRRRGRWRLAKVALGSQAGTAQLHVVPGNDVVGSLVGFSKEYLEANPIAKTSRSFECSVRTLDDLCQELKIPAIDLLKIDVEGFEFETLRGGREMLRRTRALVIELSTVRRGDGAHALVEMLNVLNEAGLQLVECIPSLSSAEHPWLPVEFNLLTRRV